MPGYAVRGTVIVGKDDFAYLSHPSIAILGGGEWLAAFNHSRRRVPSLHPPSDPLFRTLLTRSPDEGASWSAPSFAPDFDWSGTECPGIAQLGDGTVVLTQFRFGWYPLGLARRRSKAGEPISLCLPGRFWTEDFGEEAWERSLFTWARGYHGLYAHLSGDRGRTFDETVKLDPGPYRDGYSRAPVVELSDGRVAYAVTEHHPPANRFTYILFSRDRCRSFEPPIPILDDPARAFSEPDLAEVAPGELYCILRSDRRGCLHGCRSLDGGRSWSAPEATPMEGLPGHLLVLRDGRLLCSYGRREPPFGIRARLSEDGGRSWKVGGEMVIRDDLRSPDLGYPTTIEYAPGRLFVCYYGEAPDGVSCIQGSYVDLTS